eukprot:tig00000144_g9058.t1
MFGTEHKFDAHAREAPPSTSTTQGLPGISEGTLFAARNLLELASATAMPLPSSPQKPISAPVVTDNVKKWDCFVSYAHADADVVFRYCDILKAAGLSIWIDRELKPGQLWMKEIGDAMAHCHSFICFLSPAYLASRNCDDEMQYAHHRLRLQKFPVFIVERNSVTLPRDYDMMLTPVKWVEQRGAGNAAVYQAACELIAGHMHRPSDLELPKHVHPSYHDH